MTQRFLSDYLVERIKQCHDVASWSSKTAAAKQKARASELSDLLGKVRTGEIIVPTG